MRYAAGTPNGHCKASTHGCLPRRVAELAVIEERRRRRQRSGIDLPLRALVWQDASGKTWLSYNDPVWLAKRHALGRKLAASVDALAASLDAVAITATAQP